MNINNICILELNLKNIPKEFKNFKYLKYLDLSYNKIKIIPYNIKHLSNLEKLNLNYNNIKYISKNIKYLINLKFIFLNNNEIKIIPKEIKYLINLNILFLKNNFIEIIPNEIKYLINLTELDLSYNKIKIIPNEIQYLINLEYLIFTNNNINIIPNEIRYLQNLKYLIISNNKIITIPNSIIYCRKLRDFYYNNNEIENISPIVNRFLNNLNNINELQIYNDDQNVHNHFIQESIFSSILNIINQNFIINNEKIINNIINDNILNEESKKLLIEYCENKDVHSKTQLTFEELLCNVWTLIDTLVNKNEIKSILNIEISDSKCKCFTGRISRLINCLNGFTNLVNINISKKQKLELENNYSIEKHKKLVKKELQERNFNEEIIEEWIKFIE